MAHTGQMKLTMEDEHNKENFEICVNGEGETDEDTASQ
jgi:hypothetical protein